MAHPQHNFTSNFNGSDGHNARLTLAINGTEHVYTPAGNDKEFYITGVNKLDSREEGAVLVAQIQRTVESGATPIITVTDNENNTCEYIYTGFENGQYQFISVDATAIYKIQVAQDGALTQEQIALGDSVCFIDRDDPNVYNETLAAVARNQYVVLKWVATTNVTSYLPLTTFDQGTAAIFVGRCSEIGPTTVNYFRAEAHPDGTIAITYIDNANSGGLAYRAVELSEIGINDGNNNWTVTLSDNNTYYLLFKQDNAVPVASLKLVLPSAAAGQTRRLYVELAGLVATASLYPITLAPALSYRSDTTWLGQTGQLRGNCQYNLLSIVNDCYKLVVLDGGFRYVTETDLDAQLAALKSRILYTIPFGAIDEVLQVDLESNNNIGACHCTLFNPNMNQDLMDGHDGNWSNICVYLGETVQTVSTHLIFAIYEFDRSTDTFKWVANTDDLVNDANLKGLRAFRLTHVKEGQTSLFSEHLYMFAMLGNVNTLRIAGNKVPGIINSAPLFVSCGNKNFPSSGSLNAATLGTDIPVLNTAQFDISSCRTRDDNKACRIFAAITNIQNAI